MTHTGLVGIRSRHKQRLRARLRLSHTLAAQLTVWPEQGRFGVLALDRDGTLGKAGDLTTAFNWASVTKVLTSIAVLRGVTAGWVGLDDPAGPPGASLRHLLSHASGVAVNSDRIQAEPSTRRIYSNRGIEIAAAHLADRAGRDFVDLLDELVIGPLGLLGTRLVGSPAHGARGPVSDLARLAREILSPDVLEPEVIDAACSVTFAGLAGILPGFGRQTPNSWGLGLEVRGSKAPHWTPPSASASTVGHFGQSGSFLWVDPQAQVACVSAGTLDFGPWAAEAWPRLGEAVLASRATSGA